jgi:hypothetical protein
MTSRNWPRELRVLNTRKPRHSSRTAKFGVAEVADWKESGVSVVGESGLPIHACDAARVFCWLRALRATAGSKNLMKEYQGREVIMHARALRFA